MAPENDNTPKAPDKDKSKGGTDGPKTPQDNSGADSVGKDSVTSLDDCQLKALLEEAVAYKRPKDREGKSELFQTLLTDAEDALRKDQAKTASGPELARYYNTTAYRRRNKRQPSSISENLTHGGSLNDLAKEELYQSASHLQRPKKSVSARQREGGSLPCNVNAGASYDKQFFLEEQAKQKSKTKKSDDMESKYLLENDSLGQEYDSCNNEPLEMEVVQTRIPRVPSIYTTKATLQIGNVDECFTFPQLERSEKAAGVDESYKHIQNVGPQYNLLTNKYMNVTRSPMIEEKKVDENGNALAQNNSVEKKRKKSGKKIEDGIKAEDVVGHRGDIIHNIDKLLQFISGTEEKSKKKLHKSEDKGKHKQRTRSSKGTKTTSNNTRGHLQKSNSMEEMSTTKLEDFHFEDQNKEVGKTPLRSTKSNADRPRERKPWVLSSEQFQQLYQNASAENLESAADFTFVTKKKKSKKRRNSLGSRKQPEASVEFHRVPSPRRKSVCSAPHSEKSVDSSDAESINSEDGDMEPSNQPISYADIAKSIDKPKCVAKPEKKKSPPHDRTVKTSVVELVVSPPKQLTKTKPEVEVKKVVSVEMPVAATVVSKNDLSSLQNWPEIRNNKVNAVKTVEVVQDWPSINNNNNTNTKTQQSNDNKLKSAPANKNKQINNVNTSRVPNRHFEEPKSPPVNNIVVVKDNNVFNTQQVLQKVSEQQMSIVYRYQMPPNIRDVQSIEKLQLRNLRNPYINNGSEANDAGAAATCEMDKRPAVVILSGGDKHISDITFGFDINEQLLSGDVCSDFINRFSLPETPQTVHHDKLVDYIGGEWENVLSQIMSGKVKYYEDEDL